MYTVEDLILAPKDVMIVLVLESPFKDELIHNHPLAGRSGLTVSKYISEHSSLSITGQPLGCYIKSQNLKSIGIMNSSLKPLDKRCYSCTPQNQSEIDAFEIIRKNPTSSRRQVKKTQVVEQQLLLDFKARVRSLKLVNQEVVFVPCGELGKKFLEHCADLNLTTLDMLPHPSFNQWTGDSDGFGPFKKWIETNL